MADENNNGIADKEELSFHWKSAVAGALLALALGGSSLGLARALFPDSTTIQAIGTWFAGSTCDSIKDECSEEKGRLKEDVDELEKDLEDSEKMVTCLVSGLAHDQCRGILGTE
jgi:hypothetical protein